MNKQYIVVDNEYNMLKKRDGYSDMSFDTYKGASCALAGYKRRYFAREGRMPLAFVTTREEYDKHDVMVERVNIMTREKYMEKRSTPRCCSPSTELYWSM